MYKTLEKKTIKTDNLTIIIHYVIGILNKYKSKENREIDITTISNKPIGNNFKIAEELLNEINVVSLINNDVELDKHVNNLYNYLKSVLENKLNLNNKIGKSLLENLRINDNTSFESEKPKFARKGTVKFFNGSKGFGFITEEGTNEEYFVHVSGLIDEIREGDIVDFQLEIGKKGSSAKNVQKD